MHSTNPNDVPSPVANKTEESALDGWKAARALLSSAVQSYSAACITLRDSCTSPSHEPLGRAMIEDTLVTVDSELDSLVLEAKNLLAMQISLTTMRNKSATLARINTLPPEILADIFTLSRNYCARNDDFRFYDLASVCAYWRDITLNMPDLWTHVDVGPDTPSGMTKLLLERTKGSPIHMHVHEPEPHNDGPTSNYEVVKTINTLAPHMHNVCVLDIESHSYSRNFVSAVLDLWLGRGSASLSKSLMVYRPSGNLVLCASGEDRYESLKSPPVHAEGVLRPLDTLHLQGVEFDWNSGAYLDLIDLRLDFSSGGGYISASQFMDMLHASPRLVILKLRFLSITGVGDQQPPNPIVLRFLKVVNIVYMDADSLKLLLPLVTLSSSSAEFGVGLRVHVYGPTRCDGQLRDFFVRSELTTLYWDHNGSSLTRWISVCQPTPYFQTLIIHHLTMEDAPEAEAGPLRSRSTSFSYPPRVILLECQVNFEGLNILISEYGVQNMRLERCMTVEEGGQDLHNIRASLLQIHTELSCSISDVDSTAGLACRTMFDH